MRGLFSNFHTLEEPKISNNSCRGWLPFSGTPHSHTSCWKYMFGIRREWGLGVGVLLIWGMGCVGSFIHLIRRFSASFISWYYFSSCFSSYLKTFFSQDLQEPLKVVQFWWFESHQSFFSESDLHLLLATLHTNQRLIGQMFSWKQVLLLWSFSCLYLTFFQLHLVSRLYCHEMYFFFQFIFEIDDSFQVV